MSAPSVDDPLGYDVLVTTDLAASGRSASGEELVLWAMGHRLTTKQLLLIGAPGGVVDDGIDVREWVNEKLTPTMAQAKGPLVEITLRKDPRISTVRAVVSIATGATAAEYDITIAVTAVLVTGQTIARVFGVSAVTVDLLAEGR